LAGVGWIDSAACAIVCEMLAAVLKVGKRSSLSLSTTLAVLMEAVQVSSAVMWQLAVVGDDRLVAVLSLGAICIMALAVGVEVVWEAISTMIGSCLIIQVSHSAILPLSSPLLSPFSYPSHLPSSSVTVLTFLIVL
jgi:hypothetical protein